MSDPINCDVCHKEGRRRLFKSCPEGWFYGEVVDDEEPDGNVLIVAVCSVECSQKFWCKGPGNLNDSPDYMKETK